MFSEVALSINTIPLDGFGFKEIPDLKTLVGVLKTDSNVMVSVPTLALLNGLVLVILVMFCCGLLAALVVL